jgi:sugar lactone lactonase YvrE
MLAGSASLAPQASAEVSANVRPTAIVLPGATSAKGIAEGKGSTFYAGDLFAGDVFRGDIRTGSAALFIDAPRGRQAMGMAVSRRYHMLFVAGGSTGQAYVYNTRSGRPVAKYQFGAAGSSVISDVAVTRRGAWFTDARQAKLYFVPLDWSGDPGRFSTLALSGPAAAIRRGSNLNGIQADPDGRTLVVAHTAKAALYTVDAITGASRMIAGVSLPNVDGIVLRGHRVWAVQNFSNQVTRIRLNHDLTTAVVERTITSALFQVPSTAALFGDTLAVVNAKFNTGIPPTADRYEVVLVDA